MVFALAFDKRRKG